MDKAYKLLTMHVSIFQSLGTQTFHLKASSEVERQRWVTALELAKAKAITLMESGWLSYLWNILFLNKVTHLNTTFSCVKYGSIVR